MTLANSMRVHLTLPSINKGDNIFMEVVENSIFPKGHIPWNKGIKYSEEYRQKLSKAHKGYKHPEEVKQKMSEAHKGQIAWNKGKKTSKETKKRISEGVLKNPEPLRYWLGRKRSEETKQKIRAYICPEEIRRRMGLSRSGEKNHNWKGGITSEAEKIRKSIEYRLWREAVFARDNWTCQICGKRGNGTLNAHHIKPFSDYPELRTSIENGITLCRECHIEIH